MFASQDTELQFRPQINGKSRRVASTLTPLPDRQLLELGKRQEHLAQLAQDVERDRKKDETFAPKLNKPPPGMDLSSRPPLSERASKRNVQEPLDAESTFQPKINREPSEVGMSLLEEQRQAKKKVRELWAQFAEGTSMSIPAVSKVLDALGIRDPSLIGKFILALTLSSADGDTGGAHSPPHVTSKYVPYDKFSKVFQAVLVTAGRQQQQRLRSEEMDKGRLQGEDGGRSRSLSVPSPHSRTVETKSISPCVGVQTKNRSKNSVIPSLFTSKVRSTQEETNRISRPSSAEIRPCTSSVSKSPSIGTASQPITPQTSRTFIGGALRLTTPNSVVGPPRKRKSSIQYNQPQSNSGTRHLYDDDGEEEPRPSLGKPVASLFSSHGTHRSGSSGSGRQGTMRHTDLDNFDSGTSPSIQAPSSTAKFTDRSSSRKPASSMRSVSPTTTVAGRSPSLQHPSHEVKIGAQHQLYLQAKRCHPNNNNTDSSDHCDSRTRFAKRSKHVSISPEISIPEEDPEGGGEDEEVCHKKGPPLRNHIPSATSAAHTIRNHYDPLAVCTFAPSINRNIVIMDKGSVRREKVSQKKLDEIHQLEDLKKKREMEECTFFPKTLLANNNGSRDNLLNQEGLQDPPGFESAIQRVMNAREKQTPKFEEMLRNASKINHPTNHAVNGSKTRAACQYGSTVAEPFTFLAEQRAEYREANKPLLYVDVDLPNGKTGRIGVHRGDDPRDLSIHFCAAYSLDDAAVEKLTKILQQKIQLTVRSKPRTAWV